ncbi:MAG: rod shape-determining protein RodA [Acidobacteriia bacterium]|nr:rod shape-determining protein RodA [Terriglobia bacterium]
MAKRGSIADFDWWLLLAVLALAGIGLIEIYSSTIHTKYAGLHIRQLYWVLLGLGLMWIAVLVDYHFIIEHVPLLYLFGVLLLILVMVMGQTNLGSKRWLGYGAFSIQPSEVFKLILVLTLARYFSERRNRELNWIDLFQVGILVIIPFALILAQPDLGTALTFFPILAVGMWLAGVRWKMVATLGLAVALVLPMGWFVLKPYQRDRLMTFIHSDADPLGRGYQIAQSKIAVGSGGLFGKGFLNGSQNRLGYVPHRHTDFIFSVVAEEQGFLGVAVVLSLFSFVIFRSIRHARTARDRYGVFIVMGVVALFAFHVIVNVGVIIGFMPVTGIPLPLVSSGGSAILTTFLALGLVLNVRMRRYVN